MAGSVEDLYKEVEHSECRIPYAELHTVREENHLAYTTNACAMLQSDRARSSPAAVSQTASALNGSRAASLHCLPVDKTLRSFEASADVLQVRVHVAELRMQVGYQALDRILEAVELSLDPADGVLDASLFRFDAFDPAKQHSLGECQRISMDGGEARFQGLGHNVAVPLYCAKSR